MTSNVIPNIVVDYKVISTDDGHHSVVGVGHHDSFHYRTRQVSVIVKVDTASLGIHRLSTSVHCDILNYHFVIAFSYWAIDNDSGAKAWIITCSDDGDES